MTEDRRKDRGSTQRSGAVRDPSRSLEKGLHILTLFDVVRSEWTLAEIRRELGLPKSTAFRLLKTLDGFGFLTFDEQTGAYRLGPAIHRALYTTFSDAEIANTAHPHMMELAATTQETVVLASWLEWPTVIDCVLTPRPFKPPYNIGYQMPGLASLHTRIFLAYEPEHRLEQALSVKQEPRTQYTITDPDRIRDDLQRIRREGVGYSLQDWLIGMCSVAAPVFGLGGAVRASLSIVTPSERFGPTEMASYANAVKEVAAVISSDLGYHVGERAPHSGSLA
ncbi:MAG: IclR family transcriptional regulator [Actinobacteria bacterium]|nr:IclR family transcriptional regulator [Actinomycetota bacterium]